VIDMRVAGGVLLLALAAMVVAYLVPGTKWIGVATVALMAGWLMWRER